MRASEGRRPAALRVEEQSKRLDCSTSVLQSRSGRGVAATAVGGTALLLSSMAWASSTRCDSAILGARTVALAAELERSLGDSSACPTLETLIRNHSLDIHKADDPFGARYRIGCIGDTVVVTSAGVDGVFGTRDDLTSEPSATARCAANGTPWSIVIEWGLFGLIGLAIVGSVALAVARGRRIDRNVSIESKSPKDESSP